LIAAAITLGASAAYAAAPQLLLDFQFNEGQGLTSKSSVGNTILTLGEAVDPSWNPVSSPDSPSGATGDLALDVTSAHGWLYTELEKNPIDVTQPFSWECWVYVDPESVQTYEDYFRLGNSIKAGTDNNHQFELTFCGVEDVASSWVVTGGAWTHLALAWQPGISVNFYVDGVWVDEIVTENMPNNPSSNILTIASDNGGGSLFDGMLDRMRFHQGIPTDIYEPGDYFDCDPANPKPLSKDTVLAFDFNEASYPYSSSTTPVVIMQSGPEIIGDSTQIQFAETTPVRDAQPEVTDDFSVYVDNTKATSNADAKKYGRFSAASIDFGDTSDASFTLESWFKGLSKSDYDKQVFFQLYSSPNGTAPRLSFAIYKDFTVYFTTLAKRDIYTGAKIPEDGGWHHVAVSFDQPNKKIKTYVDGQLVSDTARNASPTGAILSTDADFAVDFAAVSDPTYVDSGTIGAEHHRYFPFTGYVDRMRFWKGVVAQEDLDYKYYGEVINPPQFTANPQNFEVQAGTPVKFSAKVVGTDTEAFPITYQWYKDGEAIEGATTLEYVVEATEATLGNYTVKASNAKSGQGGEATSATGKLSFSAATPKAPTKLIDFDFTEGQGITTTSAVGGLVASLGTEYIYNPETDDDAIVADSFFSSKDTVLKSVGKSWLTSEEYETALLDRTKPFTLETWVYIDPENDKTFEGYIVCDNSIKIGCNSQHEFEMTFYGVADIMSGITVPLGQWQHYAASYDPAAVWYDDQGVEQTGVVYFYLNGDFMAEVGQATGPNDRTGKKVLIGGESGWPIWGCMNRARIHQGVASDPYSAYDYLDCDPQNPKPVKAETVLSYSFDNPEFPQVNEVSPAIELTNAGKEYADQQNAKNVQWSTLNPEGKEGAYSLLFDATKSRTAKFDISYLKIDGEDPSYTAEAWIKTTKPSSRQVLFSNNGPSARFSFSVNSDMTVHSTTYGIKDYTTSASIPNDGDWHHVAFILDWQSEWVYAYVDGVLCYEGDVYVNGSGQGMLFDGSYSDGFIGSEGGSYFTGNIARLRIHSGVVAAKDLDYYNIDLGTAPEILALDIPEITAGEKATLSVLATGKEPLSYQWYKNGAAIDGATDATYVIEETTMADAGSYSVTVSNALGEKTSDAVAMPVVSADSDLTTILNFQLNEGQGLKFASKEGNAVGSLERGLYFADGVSGIAGDKALGLEANYLRGQFPEETIEYAKGSLAFEAWVYATSTGIQDFFRFGGSLKVGINSSGKFQMTLLGVADVNSSIVVPLNEWTHLAAFLEAGKGVTFFMNGEQVDFVECTGAAKAVTDPVFSLGADPNGGSAFIGCLDRVRLAFTNSLTAEDLDSDPANPRSPEGVLEYSFDGEAPFTSQGVMEIALDPIAKAAAWAVGPYDGEGDFALQFNGRGVKFDSSNINFGDTSDKSFSLEAWVNMTEIATRQILFTLPGNDNGTCPSISVSVLDSGVLRITTMSVKDINTGIIIPRDGEWHEIAASWNQPAGIICIYIDGNVAGSVAYTGDLRFTYPGWWGSNPTNTGLIGCESSLTSAPLTGSVDRIKVWKGVVGSANLDYPASAPEKPIVAPVIAWGVEDGIMTISWDEGGLEVSSDNINWTPIDQASPLNIDLSTATGNMYYRIAK